MYDDFGNPIGTMNPAVQRKLAVFNMARGLFPYAHGNGEATTISTADVITAAQEIETFIYGEVA